MAADTLPMPLESLRGGRAALDEFRVHAPSEVQSLLRQLQDGNVLLHLSCPGGDSYTTTVWALDPSRNLVCFSADRGNDPRLQRLLESDEVVAVAYLDSIKVQFDVHGLVLVHGVNSAAVNAAYPRELYRFQRRSSYRVRPLGSATPTAFLPTPEASGGRLELRVIDVSLTGVALFLPDDAPRVRPGATLHHVSIELDGDTRLHTSLKIHHVTALNPDTRGSRLGCELVGLAGDAARALQRYIDQTQKRRRTMTLDSR